MLASYLFGLTKEYKNRGHELCSQLVVISLLCVCSGLS